MTPDIANNPKHLCDMRYFAAYFSFIASSCGFSTSTVHAGLRLSSPIGSQPTSSAPRRNQRCTMFQAKHAGSFSSDVVLLQTCTMTFHSIVSTVTACCMLHDLCGLTGIGWYLQVAPALSRSYRPHSAYRKLCMGIVQWSSAGLS